MVEPTDNRLRAAGAYDPARGQGIADEMDWGNFSGSILMLAMLDPELFATPQVHRLSIWGEGLLQLGTAAPHSGHGPDNRRTNALEAILNYLEAFPAQVYLRQLLLRNHRLGLGN